MIHVYGSDQRIETVRAVTTGGISVLLDERRDLGRVLGLCLDIERVSYKDTPGTHPGDETARDDPRLRRLYGQLVGGSGLPLESADPEEAAELDPILERTGGSEPIAAFDGLVIALVNLLAAWKPAEPPPTDPDARIRGILGLADPLRAGDPEVSLTFAVPTPALLIRPGSVVATLGLATIAASPRWIGGLVGGVRLLWRSADAAGKALVDGTRAKAHATARHKNLARLNQPEEAQGALGGKPVAVVLMHGLFSTDLGTFDGFIDRLRRFDLRRWIDKHPPAGDPLHSVWENDAFRSRREALKTAFIRGVFGSGEPRGEMQRQSRLADAASILFKQPGISERLVDGAIGICGWPHDTLAPIDANAQKLADTLYRQFNESPGTRIVLVGHSRGGLVARAAAVKLASGAYGDFVERIRLIVTFGTPHEGSPLAEHDARTLGTYFLLLNATGTAASVLDVLTYLGARSGEGILDLKPIGAATAERPRSYTYQLLEDERSAAGRLGRPLRVTPVVAIGGNVGRIENPTRLQRAAMRFVRWHAGAADHDLVVPLDSSLSADLPPSAQLTVPCNHFGYFPADNVPTGVAAGLDLAALCVLAEIPELDQRIRKILAERKGGEVYRKGDKLIVGEVAVDVNPRKTPPSGR